jgi:hypothetical protein
MNCRAKHRSTLLASIGVVALATAQAQAQPMATYNTETFDYWHLTAEGWKMPPQLPPEQAKATHDYVYSLALQAGV